jgi:hypothetical protein
MRIPAVILMSSLSVLTAGCSVDVLHYGAFNLVYQPCKRANGAKECCKAKELAEDSWRKFQASNPGVRYSKDFAEGYVFGFADYVEKGGGIPPVVPPYRYRKVKYETPEGHERIAEWFSGCRAGIAAGIDSGYREYVILPMSVPPPKPTPGYDMMPMAPGVGEPMLPAPQMLPAPTGAAPVPAPAIARPPSAVPAPPVQPRPEATHAEAELAPPKATSDRSDEGVQGRVNDWPAPVSMSRTTPPPPMRTTVPPPWDEEHKPATESATPDAVAAQRLAAAMSPPSSSDNRLLGDPSPIDAGVWLPARDAAQARHTSSTTPAEPRPIAVGQPAKSPQTRTDALRSESPPAPIPADDPATTVSHRGARWQN